MRWALAIRLFACIVSPVVLASCAAPLRLNTSAFDRDGWRADYAFLKRTLETAYSNLAWFASPSAGVDLPALDRRTQRLLDLAESDADAKAALLAFVAAFHDGHFSTLASVDASVAATSEPPQAALDALDAASGCAALGYAVTRRTAFSQPFESLPGFRLDADGVSTPFRAGTFVTAAGTRLGFVRIAYFRQSETPALCIDAWNALRASAHAIDRAIVRKNVESAWFAALAVQLKRYTQENASALIVDVGDNGGGNDSGDWSARLFTPRPVHSARLWMAAADDARAYADEQLDGLRTALAAHPEADAETRRAVTLAIDGFTHRKDAIGSRHCDLSWAWRERRDWNPTGCSRLLDMGFASGALDYAPAHAFGGGEIADAMYWPATVDTTRGAWSRAVYVLTNARTFSAAEMFTAVMRDNGIARTVGATTGGDGCGFMQEEKAVELPHSRLRLRIPDCVRLRADGSDEVAGIAPDLPIAPRAGEGERARALRTLDAIDADLRAANAAPPH